MCSISSTPSRIEVRVPPGAVLLGQRHERAVGRGAGGAPRVGQQHQRQQARGLTRRRVVRGQQPAHLAGQPDRLAGQLDLLQVRAGRRRVALVEDQVQHVQHDGEPLGPLRAGGHLERRARLLDLLLRPADPLRHRRLGDQERARDLLGREAADRAQRQRHLRRRRQRRVAAQEQQRQRVVDVLLQFVGGRRGDQLVVGPAQRVRRLAPPPGRLAAPLVGEPPPGDRDQPPGGLVRHAVGRPLHGRGQQRLLHGVLARVELAVPAHEHGEDPRRERAQQVLDRPGPRHHRPITACRTRPRT